MEYMYTWFAACYPGREEIASTLACASFVGLVEALPAWRSGVFLVFLAWIPGLQTARVLSRQLTIAEPKWQRAFGHQHYNFASSSFYAARFFASSQLLVSSYSFARCLVRRRGTIKFHDFQCFVRQQWYVSIRFYQPWWTTERSLKP